MPGQPAIIAIVYACGAICALLLFQTPQRSLSSLYGWCTALTLMVSLAIMTDPASNAVAARLPALAVTVFLLSASLMLMMRRLSPPLLVALATLLTLLPLWAAPLVEAAGNPWWLTAAVVNASPLTAFAAALEIDYLRTGWFYANSALGSMRYSYPAWQTYCLVLAVLPAAALLARLIRSLNQPLPQLADEGNS